ncbi:MAG: PGF-CTERM sorting domain-containing protein [Candidatus Methanoperedens sp.]
MKGNKIQRILCPEIYERTYKEMLTSFVFLLFILFAVTPTVSASMVKISLEDLTGEADVILIGDVKEVESRWNLWRTMIYTYSTLSVEKYIKGTGHENETLTIITKGGEVGDYGVWVEDTPLFTKNETVLVFLKKEGNEFSVAGWAQGKYIVENESVRDISGENVSLQDFLRRIDDAIPPQDAATPVRTPEAPGFEMVFGIIGVLAVWFVLRERSNY